jgi:DNA-binding SARP family transcriptional activator
MNRAQPKGDRVQDRLFIRMLTGGDLLVESPIPIQWKGRSTRILFALLALKPGEMIPRDQLADQLSTSDQRAARGNLRMALLALRRAVDPVDPDLIRATNESIMLNVQREDVDWALFETLCARPDAESGLKALDLYRGDLLATFPVPAQAEAVNEFLHVERERLREIAIKTGVGLITAFEAQGEPDRIGSIAHKILTIEPTNEAAHRAMMRAHATAGDRPTVLRQYERCRRALMDYDLAPSAQTMALRDEIIGAEAGEFTETVEPSDMPVRDKTPSLSPPPGQHKRPGWRSVLPVAFVLVTLGLVGLTYWPCWLTPDCAENTPLPMIVLSLEFDENDRYVAEVADDIRKTFEETLGRVAAPIFFTQLATAGELPDLLDDSYIVRAIVKRSGDGLRIYVELGDGGSKTTPDKFLYDTDFQTIEGLADQLETGLIPALQSRIGLDQLSK